MHIYDKQCGIMQKSMEGSKLSDSVFLQIGKTWKIRQTKTAVAQNFMLPTYLES